jgi:hypothetical protein
MTTALQFGPLMMRTRQRAQVVLYYRRLVASGVSKGEALKRAAQDSSFQASPTSIGRWVNAYERGGVRGLLNSSWRLGRKPGGKR